MNDLTGFKFFCQESDFRRSIQLAIIREPDGVGGGREYVSSMVCERIEGDEMLPPNAIFDLRLDQARHLMDTLWACGVRPAPTLLHREKGAEAMQLHLGDMRAIAFSRLKLEVPK